MWQAVRRELARLEWDVEPTLTLDLMADWTQTVSRLVMIRRALAPISTADPLALLATACAGPIAASPEARTARYLQSIRGRTASETVFVRKMPKS